MERFVGRLALVTGASVGIGAAVSTALLKHGVNVVGCGRNLERLQEFESSLQEHKFPGLFHCICCDVGKEEEVIAMFEDIKKNQGGVDICINNAGVSHNEPLLKGSSEKWQEMLNVNVLGLAVCTREAVKSMRSRNVDDGHIINLCSLSGHRLVGSSSSNFYSATKHAVKALTEGTRTELRELKSHIRITEISPGVVEDTEFFGRAQGKEKAEKFLKSAKFLEAKDVADAVIYALSAPPHVQVHDLLIRSVEQRS